MATLNTDEVNALMDVIKEGAAQQEADPSTGSANRRGAVSQYDLTNRDRIIRGQMPTHDAINEQIASMLATGFSGRTRMSLKVTTSPATLLKFVDFNALLAPPTLVGVLSLGQGHGMALAALDPGLCDALLAAALGDRKARTDDQPLEARRELTSVERMVLKRLLSLLTDAMARAWAPVLAIHPELLRFESDPRLAVIAPPNESAILSTYEISGGVSGRIQLAMPFSTVEPVKKLLLSAPRVNNQSDSRFTRRLIEELEQIQVEVSANLGVARVSVGRVLDLLVGDVLTLDTDEGVAVPVCIEGRPKMLGQPRIAGGSHAIVLEQALAPQSVEPLPAPAPVAA